MLWLVLGLVLYLLIGLILAWRVRAQGWGWLSVSTCWLPMGVLLVVVGLCLPDPKDPDNDW